MSEADAKSRESDDASRETDVSAMDETESKYADLDTVDISGTRTVDLYDRVDEIREEVLPEERARLDELREEYERASAEDGQFSEAALAAQSDAADVRERIQTLEHTARVFHTCAQRWGGSEFTLTTNLAFHEVQAASDDIAEMTVASGLPEEVASAKRGAYKLRVLMFGIEDSPPEAPAPNDDEFPWQVGQYLYQQFDDINSRGDVSAGNSFSRAEDQTE